MAKSYIAHTQLYFEQIMCVCSQHPPANHMVTRLLRLLLIRFFDLRKDASFFQCILNVSKTYTKC